ncbi:MAG: hypothetical protein AAGA54_23970, partial [Myxococcota bacterium]
MNAPQRKKLVFFADANIFLLFFEVLEGKQKNLLRRLSEAKADIACTKVLRDEIWRNKLTKARTAVENLP